MEEIMMKNVWEIENNPFFSSGTSLHEENLDKLDKKEKTLISEFS